MNTEEYDKAGRLSVEDQQMMGSPFIMLTPKEVRSMSWQDTILSERHESGENNPKNLAPNDSSMHPIHSSLHPLVTPSATIPMIHDCGLDGWFLYSFFVQIIVRERACRYIASSSLTNLFSCMLCDLQPKMMDVEEAPLSSTPTKVAPFMPESLKAIQMPKPFHI